MIRTTLLCLLLALLAVSISSFHGCASPGQGSSDCPVPGGWNADHLIQPGEEHFARLWMLTDGGENAEAYWNSTSDRLVFQARNKRNGVDCDRIYVTTGNRNDATTESGNFKVPRYQVSNGRGVTTCSYFMPGDDSIVFCSTHARHETCPPRPDMRNGYVWAIYPQYDIYVRDLQTDELRRIVDAPGYDAEATVSPNGDRIVFTSTRSGDIELWTCDLDGNNLFQVTDALGYDGGAFYSHSGEWLVFRSTAFTPGLEEQEKATYRELLADWKVKPGKMEIMIVRPDGTERTQVTNLGGANFAPYFFPDDSRIMFSTNHHDLDNEGMLNFDLFAVNPDGEELERITTYEGFDCFPMFSPDGRYLAFSSNRGNSNPGETNIFIAEWRD